MELPELPALPPLAEHVSSHMRELNMSTMQFQFTIMCQRKGQLFLQRASEAPCEWILKGKHLTYDNLQCGGDSCGKRKDYEGTELYKKQACFGKGGNSET